jgi:hypothetical protein
MVVGGLQDLPYLDHFDDCSVVDGACNPNPQQLRRIRARHGLFQLTDQPYRQLRHQGAATKPTGMPFSSGDAVNRDDGTC